MVDKRYTNDPIEEGDAFNYDDTFDPDEFRAPELNEYEREETEPLSAD